MRSIVLRATCVLALALACFACGKRAEPDAPLAYVPADAPYVFANAEPMPDVMLARWTEQMKSAWPLMMQTFDNTLGTLTQAQAKSPTPSPELEPALKIARAILDEVRTRDTPDKWREIGLDPKARAAFYGIGLTPVLRITLSDPDAFRAMLARVEQKGGLALGTAKIGDQDVRTFGADAVQGLLAIEGKQLVLTVVPVAADEALKRRALGLDRPERSLADDGALAALDKERGYLPYGSGWVDVRRVLAALTKDPAVAAFAKAAGTPPPALDATCAAEFDAIAAKFPRIVSGYTHIDGNTLDLHARLELAPALAQALVKIGGSPPGKLADDDVLLDFGFALPVLKARDFWVEQADAVAKSPFQCTLLAPLNQSFAEAKAKIDQTLPPPLSDITGARITARRFAWAEGAAKPDFAGEILIGTTNPMFLVSLAQMTAPALQSIKLTPDGKPATIPTDAVPGAAMAGDLVINAAIGTGALGLAVGADEAARLTPAVTAPAGTSGTLLEARYGGRFYLAMSDMVGRMVSQMPAEQRAQMDSQRKLYALYAQWFKYFDLKVSTGAAGIDFTEHVEFNPK